MTGTAKGKHRRALAGCTGPILVKLAGDRVRSFAIITTTPKEPCAELDNRMPMILGPDA